MFKRLLHAPAPVSRFAATLLAAASLAAVMPEGDRAPHQPQVAVAQANLSDDGRSVELVLENRGKVAAEAGMAVTIYVERAGVGTPIATVRTAAPMPSGGTSKVLRLEADSLTGAGDLSIRLNDDGVDGPSDPSAAQITVWPAALRS